MFKDGKLYRMVGFVVLYWVASLIGDVEAEDDKRAKAKAVQKENDRLVDWDYAQLALIHGMPEQDIHNYYHLVHLRRERQERDMQNVNKSASREKYENDRFRKLYNAVFSTKSPHLRSSHENYIQFLKDEFFAKQRVPENPKTSRERYEWFLKKQKGSFFGGKYDFDTYLAGNFTARRRRRAVDVEDEPKTARKMHEINSEELRTMKLEDNVVNLVSKMRQGFEGATQDSEKKKNEISAQTKHEILNEIKLPNTGNKVKMAKKVNSNGNKNVKVGHNKNIGSIVGRQEEDYLNLEESIANHVEMEVNRRSKSVRGRRHRRELTDMYINKKDYPLNRSWYLDPRNPWNKNLRYIKHVKLFGAFYLDFYERTGSDKLPSNETFCKIQPPKEFYATKNPYSARFDSQPLSYYVKSLERMAQVLSKYDPNDGFVYGRPSKDFRREERNKNYSAILAIEELAWKKKLSQMKLRLKLKNITKVQHDKMLQEIEMDKKAKYKLYRTRTTKHIVRQAMEALSLAAGLAGSCIIRDKRDVQAVDMESEDTEYDFVNAQVQPKKKFKSPIKSKRVRRNDNPPMNHPDALEDFNNLQIIHKSIISGKRILRKKRWDHGSWPHGSYNPPLSNETVKTWRGNPHDYGPIARHNAFYYDDSQAYSHPLRTKSTSTPSTSTKSKRTTTLSPEVIAERTRILKMLTQDYESAVRFAEGYEKNFRTLKDSLNITMRKKRDVTPAIKIMDRRFNFVDVENAKKDLHKLIKIINTGEVKSYHNGNKINQLNHCDTKNILAKESRRQKRSMLEDLLKGPPPDKFEEKKTKLEVDKEAAAKQSGLKKFVFDGTENVNKAVYQLYEGNINQINVNKKHVNYDFQDSRRHPDHPDHHRADQYAWRENEDRKMNEEYKAEGEESLGIRERMYQDYIKLKNKTDVGRVDRRIINLMEMERAHQERKDFLNKQTLPSTTIKVEVTCDPKDLSSFQSGEKRGGKKMGVKEKMNARKEELLDWRKGIL